MQLRQEPGPCNLARQRKLMSKLTGSQRVFAVTGTRAGVIIPPVACASGACACSVPHAAHSMHTGTREFWKSQPTNATHSCRGQCTGMGVRATHRVSVLAGARGQWRGGAGDVEVGVGEVEGD